MRMPLNNVQLLRGDVFAYDGGAYTDGDLLYAVVDEVVLSLPDTSETFGSESGGCRVRVYCAEERDAAVHFYAWDFIDRLFASGDCIQLTHEQMARCEHAGWPRTYGRFLEVLAETARPPGCNVMN